MIAKICANYVQESTSMATAPRPNGKGKKIAYALLGKPESMKKNSSAFSKEIREKLNADNQLKMR